MKKLLTIALIFLSLFFVACDNSDTQTDDEQTADESEEPDDTDTDEPAAPAPVAPDPEPTPDPKEGVRLVIFSNSTTAMDLYFEVTYNGKTRTYNPSTPMVILLSDAEITTDVHYYCSAQGVEDVTFAVGYYVNGNRCVLQEMTGKKGDPAISRTINQTFSKDFCKNYLTFDRAYEYDIDKAYYNPEQEYNVVSF